MSTLNREGRYWIELDTKRYLIGEDGNALLRLCPEVFENKTTNAGYLRKKGGLILGKRTRLGKILLATLTRQDIKFVIMRYPKRTKEVFIRDLNDLRDEGFESIDVERDTTLQAGRRVTLVANLGMRWPKGPAPYWLLRKQT